MKPRGAKQKQFCEWAGMLPPLKESQKEWAKKLFPAQALYYSRRGNNCEFHCMCCGAVVPTLGKWLLVDCGVDKWTCPECGAECEVLPQYNGGFRGNYNSRTRQYGKSPIDTWLVTLADVFKGVQVFRTFEVYRWNGRTTDRDGKPCGKPTEFFFHEIWQNWVLEGGSEIITSRHYTRGINFFRWDYNSEWGINYHNAHYGGYYVFEDVFGLDGHAFFPGRRLTPILRRNGLSARFIGQYDMDPAKLAVRLLKDNAFETVFKQGQLRMAGYLLNNEQVAVGDFLNVLSICTRHGYKIADPGLWFDYLNDLRFLGMDTHSPVYLCPKDLREAHDKTNRRRQRIEERRREEERAKEAKKWEERYAVAKAPFLGIAFGDDTVSITVLQTVEDVRLEGKAMHHCVFSNGYYKKPDRVLLTAKDMEGNRLETIEVGLDPFKVLQSRGLQNKATKEHQRIVSLVEVNMDAFRRAVPKMTVPLHLTGKNANYYQD